MDLNNTLGCVCVVPPLSQWHLITKKWINKANRNCKCMRKYPMLPAAIYFLEINMLPSPVWNEGEFFWRPFLKSHWMPQAVTWRIWSSRRFFVTFIRGFFFFFLLDWYCRFYDSEPNGKSHVLIVTILLKDNYPASPVRDGGMPKNIIEQLFNKW